MFRTHHHFLQKCLLQTTSGPHVRSLPKEATNLKHNLSYFPEVPPNLINEDLQLLQSIPKIQ